MIFLLPYLSLLWTLSWHQTSIKCCLYRLRSCKLLDNSKIMVDYWKVSLETLWKIWNTFLKFPFGYKLLKNLYGKRIKNAKIDQNRGKLSEKKKKYKKVSNFVIFNRFDDPNLFFDEHQIQTKVVKYIDPSISSFENMIVWFPYSSFILTIQNKNIYASSLFCTKFSWYSVYVSLEGYISTCF